MSSIQRSKACLSPHDFDTSLVLVSIVTSASTLFHSSLMDSHSDCGNNSGLIDRLVLRAFSHSILARWAFNYAVLKIPTSKEVCPTEMWSGWWLSTTAGENPAHCTLFLGGAACQ